MTCSMKGIRKHPLGYYPQILFLGISTAVYAVDLDKAVLVQFLKASHMYNSEFASVVVYRRLGGSDAYITGWDKVPHNIPKRLQFAHS